jgi:hypothetical protein
MHNIPLDLQHTPETATAAEHPCAAYLYHAPAVVRTQYHHTKPMYLQERLYGKVLYGADLWLCGNCHDSVHEWLGYLLGESRMPNPQPGWKIKKIAQATFDWYVAASA